MHRLSIFRTPRHIYAQVIGPDGDQVVAAASTVQKELRDAGGYTGNVASAAAVGKAIAEKAKTAGTRIIVTNSSPIRWGGEESKEAVLADAGTVEPRARESLGMKTPEKTVILVVEP